MDEQGRSLLDVAHGLAASQHNRLVTELNRAGAERLHELIGEQDARVPEVELALEVAAEALELLHGPRPDYAAIAGYLEVAARSYRASPTVDSRAQSPFCRLWGIVSAHLFRALREAAGRFAEDEKDEGRRGPAKLEVVR